MQRLGSSVFRRFASKKKNVLDKTTISNNTALSNASISEQQELYMTSKYSPGSVFFLGNGAKVFNSLVSFMRAQETRILGFEEVMTPLIYKKELFEISNHWKYYKDDMFQIHRKGDTHEDVDEVYGLKPMNCPGHCVIFKQKPKHTSQLPIRYSDFSSLHRNEASGALSGLTRVRRFHQDDGHIFCLMEHIDKEITANLKLIDTVYKIFGMPNYKFLLSTRPKELLGSAEDWQEAESILSDILNRTGKPWEVSEGDGAFYGPKIDVIVEDKHGKFHQTATVQLDFQLPKQFELEVRNDANELGTPIMIHRAIFGSVERFLAILLDHFGGKWPFWLSPNQIRVLPISPEKHGDYAHKVEKYLINNGDHESDLVPLVRYDFAVSVDDRAATVGKRMKEAHSSSCNYVVVVGDNELQHNTVSVKKSGTKETIEMSLPELLQFFKTKVDKYE